MIRRRAIIIAQQHQQLQQQCWWYSTTCYSSTRSAKINISSSQYHLHNQLQQNHQQQQHQQQDIPMRKQQRVMYHYITTTHKQQYHNTYDRYNNRSIFLHYSTNQSFLVYTNINYYNRKIYIPFHSLMNTNIATPTSCTTSRSSHKMQYHQCSTIFNNTNNNQNNQQQQQQQENISISKNDNNTTNTDSTTSSSTTKSSKATLQQQYNHRRVWKAKPIDDATLTTTTDTNYLDNNHNTYTTTYWTDRVIDQSNKTNRPIDELIQQISTQSDVLGGKLPPKQLGVLHQDPVKDMQMLIDNYTVKAVASALRDREDALQYAATLASDPNKTNELITFLQIFHPKYVLERRQQQKTIKRHINIFNPNDDNNNNNTTTTSSTTTTNDPVTALHLDASRQLLRKALMRMPRTITTAHSKRAGICIPLCLCNNIPCILFEKRASHLKNHPNDICFPGGMVCDIQDQTIVSTSIREMKEEIGGLDFNYNNNNNNNNSDDHNNDINSNNNNNNNSTIPSPIEVIGILRLNWGEVHHLTGVAVTPVVCYLGELPDQLYPNPEEVSEVFTIPLIDLLNKSYWIHQDSLAPIFIGGPYVIWGLTGYILERFAIELGRLST